MYTEYQKNQSKSLRELQKNKYVAEFLSSNYGRYDYPKVLSKIQKLKFYNHVINGEKLFDMFNFSSVREIIFQDCRLDNLCWSNICNYEGTLIFINCQYFGSELDFVMFRGNFKLIFINSGLPGCNYRTFTDYCKHHYNFDVIIQTFREKNLSTFINNHNVLEIDTNIFGSFISKDW